MEQLDIYIKAKQFEESILKSIQLYLSDEETIVRDYRLSDGSPSFCLDFFLPKGCKAIGWPINTGVEIKLFLQTNTLLRWTQYISPVINAKLINKAILVCHDKHISSASDILPWLQVLDYEEFKNILKDSEKNKAVRITSGIEEKDIIEKAKETFNNDKYTLFLGAGLSRSANLPDWNELLEALLIQVDGRPYSEINEENAKSISSVFSNSAIITGRYAFDGYRKSVEKSLRGAKIRARNESTRRKMIDEETNQLIVDRIRGILYKHVEHSDLVASVAGAIKTKHPEQVITYNYDSLIEDELNDPTLFVSVYDKNIPRRKVVPIYHVHGMISKDKNLPSFPVLSEKEYHAQYINNASWSNVAQLNALNSSSCFFVGLSMTDPNLRRLLDFARYEDQNSDEIDRLPHYVFLKRDCLKGEASKSVNKEHWAEMEQMMNSFGLNVIWFKKFEDLPLIIDYISGKSLIKPQI